MKFLTNQLHLFKDDLKVKKFNQNSWKTIKEWRKLKKVPMDGEDYSEISVYAPIKDSHNQFILTKNKRGEVSFKQELKVYKILHESQLRDAIEENISDLSTFSDSDFYGYDTHFLTVSNVIASFENHEQEIFNVKVWHNLNATSEEIEYKILQHIVIQNIQTREEQRRNPLNLNEDGTLKHGVAEDLVKISLCTYWMDKLKEKEQDKIKEMSKRTGGKFYFQSDQRCKTVESLVYDFPLVASEILSYSDWYKKHSEVA